MNSQKLTILMQLKEEGDLEPDHEHVSKINKHCEHNYTYYCTVD